MVWGACDIPTLRNLTPVSGWLEDDNQLSLVVESDKEQSPIEDDDQLSLVEGDKEQSLIEGDDQLHLVEGTYSNMKHAMFCAKLYGATPTNWLICLVVAVQMHSFVLVTRY